MEVHHHGHVEHSNNWKSYLYQFAMLFLAVLCGSMAEYQLEHKIERDREEDYVVSLVRELEQDLNKIDLDMKNKKERMLNADSLSALMLNGNYQNNTALVYYRARKLSVIGYFFHATDGTFVELKNSGGLRLIRKRKVVDDLQTYYNMVQQVDDAQNISITGLNNYRDIMTQLFNVRIFDTMIKDFPEITIPVGNPALFSNDPTLINQYLIRVQFTRTIAMQNNKKMLELKNFNSALQKLIKEEYDLK